MIYLTADGAFGNPASWHLLGKAAKSAVEAARAQVADLIHAEADEIIWTSGATEANNLALKGAAQLYQRKGKHIVTLKTEHKSVLDTCQQLEKQGFHVTYLNPAANGLLDLAQFQAALREDTMLASIMLVNNELGVIQDIAAIAKMTAERGILLHVDAVQAAGKIAINVQQWPVDLMSLSAHKVYGPKGVGALYLRKKPRVRVQAQIHGGGQEQGMRSGTLPTHQIVGMGEACRLAAKEMAQDSVRIRALRDKFLAGLTNVTLNTPLAHSVPHIVNLRFARISGEKLMAKLPELAVSMGSACQSSETGPSYVLRALGQSDEEARAALRISFGRMTTEEEVMTALASLGSADNSTEPGIATNGARSVSDW